MMSRTKMICCASIISVIIFGGCKKSNQNDEEPYEEITTNHIQTHDVTKDVHNYGDMTPDDSTAVYVPDCEAPGYFSNLADFYTFALTGSRNPDRYSDTYTKKHVAWYASIEPEALIKIEDLFGDPALTADVSKILILYQSNRYSYVLHSGITIDIYYYEGQNMTNSWPLNNSYYTFLSENDSQSFLSATSQKNIYLKKIGDVTVGRQRRIEPQKYYLFYAGVDEYEIQISTYPSSYPSVYELLADPKNQRVAALFDPESSEGIVYLIENIRKAHG